MIEIIRTYSGYPRPEGKIKQTFAYMYRCSKCGLIKDTLQEMKPHDCIDKIGKKNEDSSSK